MQAQHNLALKYYKGEGIERDNIRADMWFNIAVSSGHENATKRRDIAAEKMTKEDISKAQQLARECMAKNYKDC